MNTKRITGILPVLSLFFLIGLAIHAQAATYNFKSLDVPGATTIYAASINASGQVAGYYYDASSAHGFVYSKGQYTTLDVPGRINTFATSINDSGQVAGFYRDAWDNPHGFVYSKGQYTILDVPGASYTSATHINASGQVAGFYRDASSTHGFVYSKGQYTTLDPPGASYTYVTSINASGQVAGYYALYSHNADLGFVYSKGQYTTLDFPGPILYFDVPGPITTSATSINASGQVAGIYYDVLGNRIYGFVYSEGQYTTLDVPGASYTFDVPGPIDTYAVSINASGQVAGYYSNASSARGFVYSKGQYTTLDVPGASYIPTSINASGQVAGNYSDGSGLHGFIATPMTPFSTFNVTRLVIDQNRGALFLWSNFTLGGDSNGINPAQEDITLKIANATLTIPAESFHKYRYPSLFIFAGQIDNVWIEALIKPLGRNRFVFQALAYGAPLGDTKNPVTVELTIGDDSGTTTAMPVLTEAAGSL